MKERIDAFAAQAVPVLTRDVQSYLEWLAPQAERLARAPATRDILAAAKLRYDENAYVELVAWALHPETHAASALRLQSRWVRSLERGLHVDEPAIPQTQVFTASGIADLVLPFPAFVLLVEAKTSTNEHAAGQSGEQQTIQYAREICAALPDNRERPVHVIFLHPERRPAAHPDALRASYAEFALLLGSELDEEDVPADLRSAMAVVARHFAEHAVPRHSTFARVLGNARAWLDEGAVDPASLVQHLHAVRGAELLAPLRGRA